MTQEQYAMASAYLSKMHKLEESLKDLKRGLENNDTAYIRANVYTDEDYLRPLEIEFYTKVRKAMQAEYERLKQTFESL